jgi:hypothetical protein
MKSQLMDSVFFQMNKVLQNTAGIDICGCIADTEQLLQKTPESIVNPVYITNGSLNIKVYKEMLCPRVSQEEFHEKLKKFALILDVRDLSQFQMSHEKNAQFVDPFDEKQMQSILEMISYKRGLPIVIVPDDSFVKCQRLESIFMEQKNIPYVSVVHFEKQK